MSKLVSATLALCLLAGPAGPWGAGVRAASAGPAVQPQAQDRVETRVYTRRQCLVTESAVKPDPRPAPSGLEVVGAVASILVPLLVDRLFGAGVSALKRAGEAKVEQDSGRQPTYLYEVWRDKKLHDNPDLGCVLVVRGTFGGADPADQSLVNFGDTGSAAVSSENQRELRVRRLKASNIPVKEIATLYEAEVIRSDDRTALRYESRFLEVVSFQGRDKPPKSDEKRALVVGVGVYGPGPRQGEPTLSLALMNMGEVKPGVLSGDALSGKRSSWLGGVGITEAALQLSTSLDFAGHPNSKRALGVMPVTVEGTFTETEKGNEALKFIAEVLGAAREDLSEKISAEILRDRGAEAEAEAAAAAEAKEKLRQGEEAAYGACLEAVAAFHKTGLTPEEKTAKRFDVERKHRAWEVARQALQRVADAPAGHAACAPIP